MEFFRPLCRRCRHEPTHGREVAEVEFKAMPLQSSDGVVQATV